MAKKPVPPARALCSLTIPYHLRQRLGRDAAEHNTSLSAMVSAILARHYGLTIEPPKKGGQK